LSPVKPKTEEFLHFLLWSADHFLRPTFRNLTDSYESWAYRNGLWRQLAALEQQQLVEQTSRTPDDRVYRLTEAGRLHALGGRDPQAKWSRRWDGVWRLVMFDIPMERNTHRRKLRRYLHSRGFGCLQGSLWITPDPLVEERKTLAGGQTNVESLILFEGRTCAGEPDAQLVAGAWDWERINIRYTEHLKVLEKRPSGMLRDKEAAELLQKWAAAERVAWLAAVDLDPLLPERILPTGYLGREAWRRRTEAFAAAAQQVHAFRTR
jgi:DNA-binding transcriptional regulator PaaX